MGKGICARARRRLAGGAAEVQMAGTADIKLAADRPVGASIEVCEQKELEREGARHSQLGEEDERAGAPQRQEARVYGRYKQHRLTSSTSMLARFAFSKTLARPARINSATSAGACHTPAPATR
ncbi:hypothetical protein T492DRAFT_854445 [Pavlovales sp. CCMP2436]|nr:hypothetical protein T492DRAFT_854445 [Pavlovales sp. CCMP2436]